MNRSVRDTNEIQYSERYYRDPTQRKLTSEVHVAVRMALKIMIMTMFPRVRNGEKDLEISLELSFTV